jgi:hypothetical protein
MNGFPNIEADNFPGIHKFYFIPEDEVSSVSEPDGMVVTVTLDALSEWLEGYSSENLSYTEEYEETDIGDRYRATLRGFFPGDSEELMDYFIEMKQSKYLVKVQDGNGETKLIGSVDIPARFRVTRIKDQERNGFEYSFVAYHHDLPPFFIQD